MKLSYEMTNTKTGIKLGVYDEKTTSRTISRYVGPFENEEDAKTYCTDFVEGYGWGYSPSAKPTIVEGKIYAYCTRWDSCD